MRFLMVLVFLMSSALAQEIYNVKETSIKGETFHMSALKGKVVLIVNIASQCGYTSQLKDLESLHKRFQSRGFLVLGVPTNDFGGQTPEDDKGMLEFCQKNYDVTFPILTKDTVKGNNKRELYKVLTEKTPKGISGEIGWNFVKFLIDRNGKVVERFGPSTKPTDKKLKDKIKSIL